MRDREPTIRSRELGLALSRAADAKGMTNNEVAARLGWSQSKVSRLHSGKRGSSNTEDISALLAICGITGPKRDELLDMARHAYDSGWWQEYGDRLPIELRTLADYEDAAIVITSFENVVVPGLLQTADYMRALMYRTPAIPANEIPERIEARLNCTSRTRRQCCSWSAGTPSTASTGSWPTWLMLLSTWKIPAPG